VRVAYICAQYPAVSHTFILREVNALRGLGVEVDTFSIRRAPPEHLLAEADRRAFESTFAIRPPQWRKLWAAHLHIVRRAPAAYLSTLAIALRASSPGLRNRLWRFFYLVQAVALWSECSARGIRHIHAHLANVAADVALLAAHLGTKSEPAAPWSWSFTMHGPTEFFDVRHFRLAEKSRRATFVVCISEYAKSQLMALVAPAHWQKLHVIHVGLPVDQFDPVDQRAPAENPTILCVGRLVPEKGQAVLLEAVAHLIDVGYDLRVTFVGDGPARPELEAMVERLGLAGQVSFVGAVGQEEIRELYSTASLFCLPSFAEGIPVALMEAMAMRCPVVSTRIAGIPELIENGDTGLLVSAGAVDELTQALRRLLDDETLSHGLGSRARAKVLSDFNIDTTVPGLVTLFRRALVQPAGESA
jgi:colanic acid/amylovoran biosynthesis glycosyltransferase